LWYPWLRYGCSFPSRAERTEIGIKYLPSEYITFDLLYSYRYSMSDGSTDMGIAGITGLQIRGIKGSMKYSPGNQLTLVNRLGFKVADGQGGKGALMSQDMIYSFRKLPVTLWYRYCIFNTDDWGSRLYLYENDLLYSYSIPALSGKGMRTYLMVKWEPGKFLELRIKYGLTTLLKTAETPEDRDELKFQLKLMF